jgi:hypothetical protein
VPYDEFILMDEGVVATVRAIYARGQELGRNPFAFSKLGDSIIATNRILRVFDRVNPAMGSYDLGDYAYLQDTIDFYRGSFYRMGAATRIGLRTAWIYDPKWAKATCQPDENMLDCEIREHNPSVMLVQVGTNDGRSPDLFRRNLTRIVEQLKDEGIIPILYTKADRLEGPTNHTNQITRQVAAEQQVPLIDFDRLAETLPNRGLKEDRIHLNVAPTYNYTRSDTFQYGNTVYNLATLIMLDRLREVLFAPAATPTP